MAIDLGVSLVGTFALYGMLQVLKDIVVEVLGLAHATPLTGKFLTILPFLNAPLYHNIRVGLSVCRSVIRSYKAYRLKKM